MMRPAGALAAFVAAGTVAVATPANAQPAPESTFRTTIAAESVITTVDNAAFAVAPSGQAVTVTDAQNQVLTAFPLTFRIGEQSFSIGQQISADGRTLTLTPDVAAVRAQSPQLVASPMEEQLALNQLAGDLGRNMGIGGFAGTVVGAAIGAVIGLGSCLVVGPACLATAPAAIGAFAGVGGVVGTLVGGGAALADSGYKYIITLQAAPGTSPYAGQDGIIDENGTGVPDANLRLPSGSADGFKSGSAGGSGSGG